MRLIVSSAASPAEIDKYLLQDEQEVVTLRQHPFVLLPWSAAAVGGLLVAITVGAMPHINRAEQLVVWGLTAFLFLELLLAAARWGVWYLVVTSERLLICSGSFRRRVDEWPKESLRGMTVDRSFYGRFWGYGSLIVQGRTFIDYIPYLEQIYPEIWAHLYPSRDLSDG